MGLLGVIRMTDNDLNTLSLGCDLTTLGLNLNTSDKLYNSFLSPWQEQPSGNNNCDII
jgi:CCR4-NOT transcription complex subunit 2